MVAVSHGNQFVEQNARRCFANGVAVVGRGSEDRVELVAHFLCLGHVLDFALEVKRISTAFGANSPANPALVHWLVVRAFRARKKCARVAEIHPEMTGLLVAVER